MKKLNSYTFTIKLLDSKVEIPLSKVFAAENARQAADMAMEQIEELHLTCEYQLFCNEEEL